MTLNHGKCRCSGYMNIALFETWLTATPTLTFDVLKCCFHMHHAGQIVCTSTNVNELCLNGMSFRQVGSEWVLEEAVYASQAGLLRTLRNP